MRILISILLFLFAFKSEGQIINASQPYRPYIASCSYLLDQYSGAAAAYSLRKLDCDYTGYAIRVRRSSDNTEQDIGFTANGDLDTSTLKTFVGANDGFVTTWYDQSNNSRDAAQTTSTRQPIIIQAGVVERKNSKPSLYYDGSRYLTVTLSAVLSQPNTIFIVGSNSGATDRHMIDQAGSTGTSRNIIGVSGSQLITYAGGLLTYGANTTNFSLYTAIFNGASSKIQRNGSGAVTGNAGTQSMGSFNIGKGQGDPDQNAIIGNISEVIIYNSNQNTNISGIESNINSYYSIY